MKKKLCFLLLLSLLFLPAARADYTVWQLQEALNELGLESEIPFRCEFYEDTDVFHIIARYDGIEAEDLDTPYTEQLAGVVGSGLYTIFSDNLKDYGFNLDLHLSVCDDEELLMFAVADEKSVEIPHPLEEIRALQVVLQVFALSASSGLSCTMTYDPAADRIVVIFGSTLTNSELNNPALQGSEVYTELMDSIAALDAHAHDSIRDALDSLEYDMDVVVLFYTSDHVLFHYTVNSESAAI